MKISDQFSAAARDYLYLLQNGYPQKTIIKLVGDRHALSGNERTMLYRGLTTEETKGRRAALLLGSKDMVNKDLHIDGLNVLITIGSYLNGNLVFVANDNYLRDASEIHGKVFRTKLFERSIQLIIDYLLTIQVASASFYFDRPVNKSEILAAKVQGSLGRNGLKGKAKAIKSPDDLLKNLQAGVVCTSDSSIIDQCNGRLFDLARQTISHHFRPDFINLFQIF